MYRKHRAAAVLALALATGGTPTAHAQHTDAGVVSGFVVDSLQRQPLGGALVAVDGTERSSFTDADGRFAIGGVPAGTRRLVVFHPLLDTLRLSVATQPFEVRAGSTTEIGVAVPAADAILRLKCGDDENAGIIGVVARADDPEPPSNAAVILHWVETLIGRGIGVRQRPRSMSAPVADDGTFLLCGIPPDVMGEVVATAGPDTSGAASVSFAWSPLLLVRLTLPGSDVERIAFAADTAQDPLSGAAPSHLRRGRAAISGTVVDDRGQAVADARVSLEGAAGAAVTDAAGRFTLGDQPSGSGLLIVRKIGLSVAELPVALSAARVNEVNVRMTRQVPALAEIVVRARRDAALHQVGFISRRARRGGNFFLDPEAMERRVNRHSLANILAEAPNLRYENGTIIGRPRGYGMPSGMDIPRLPPTCVRYLVDGYPWSVSGLDDPLAWLTPPDIAAVEVYRPGEAPPDLPYRGAVAYDAWGNGCEVVVLWTRHKLATR